MGWRPWSRHPEPPGCGVRSVGAGGRLDAALQAFHVFFHAHLREHLVGALQLLHGQAGFGFVQRGEVGLTGRRLADEGIADGLVELGELGLARRGWR